LASFLWQTKGCAEIGRQIAAPLIAAESGFGCLDVLLTPCQMTSQALQRSGAITLEGTEGFTVSDSLFERIDGNGVMLNGQ
jgi:hypothetical protein